MAHAKECRCYDCHIGEIREEICKIREEIKELFRLTHHILHLIGKSQHGFKITQMFEGDEMSIKGVVVGATGVFQETPTPAGAVIPAGSIPVWTTDAAATDVVLTPSADGTQVSAAVSATSTLTTFNLSVANQDGSFLTTVAVPVLPVTPPPQAGFAIDQLS